MLHDARIEYGCRLDPKTGDIKLKQVPTSHAQPYGIAVTHAGVPYFCEFGTNKLASIGPKTLAITEYALPNAEARPRRIAVAPDDTIYYTDYARGYLGHFDPATRKFEEWPSPGGSGSNPYGIAITRDAVVWYSESGVHPNTLVRFAPKAKTFSSTPIPSGGGVVRNMAATKDGRLYLACSGVDKVAWRLLKYGDHELRKPIAGLSRSPHGVLGMNWIADRLKTGLSFRKSRTPSQAPGESSRDERAMQCWMNLVDGFKRAVKEFQRLDGAAHFKQVSDFQYRISNPSMKIAVVVNADLAACTIRYSYEPEEKNFAVPEAGVLALREWRNSVQLYSADQRLNSEEARR